MAEKLSATTEASERIRESGRATYYARKALAGLAIPAVLVGEFAYSSAVGIKQNQELAQSSEISIDYKQEALNENNSQTAIVFIDGFGTHDADNLVNSIGESFQEHLVDGEVWSVNYGNAPLSIEAIAEQIVEKAAQRNITKVVLAGYSAGGDIAIAVTEVIQKISTLHVPLITAISTPDGTETLRPKVRNMVANFTSFISDVPLIAYSNEARFIGEMIIRNPRFMPEDQSIDSPDEFFQTAGNFIDTAIDASHDLRREDYPKTWLLVDQYLAIDNAHLEERIQTIGRQGSHTLKPVIAYFGTSNGYDYMVDDEMAGENICNYSSAAGLSCIRTDVPGAVHTRPQDTKEAYAETFVYVSGDIQQMLAQELQAYNLANFNSPRSGPFVAV